MTALGRAIDLMHKALNNKHNVMVLYFDMSNAFDMVDLDLLSNKP